MECDIYLLTVTVIQVSPQVIMHIILHITLLILIRNRLDYILFTGKCMVLQFQVYCSSLFITVTCTFFIFICMSSATLPIFDIEY
jgi:hypothetical protein